MITGNFDPVAACITFVITTSLEALNQADLSWVLSLVEIGARLTPILFDADLTELGASVSGPL